MKILDALSDGWLQYLVLALLFAPVKVIRNLSQTQLPQCQAVFARAALILDKPFLQPNIQPLFLDSCPHLPYVSLPRQPLSCCMAQGGEKQSLTNRLKCGAVPAGFVRVFSAGSACCRRTGIQSIPIAPSLVYRSRRCFRRCRDKIRTPARCVKKDVWFDAGI